MPNDRVMRRPVVHRLPGSNHALATVTITDAVTGQEVVIGRNLPWHIAHNVTDALLALFSLTIEAQVDH